MTKEIKKVLKEVDIENQFHLSSITTDAKCVDLGITSLEKLILLCLINRANKSTGWVCWPSQKTLMESTGICDVKTLRKWTKKLVERGFVSSYQEKSSDATKPYNSLTYTVHVDHILSAINKQHTFAGNVKPMVNIPVVKKPPISNEVDEFESLGYAYSKDIIPPRSNVRSNIPTLDELIPRRSFDEFEEDLPF